MTDSVADSENELIKTKWNQKQMLGLAPDLMTARATNRLIDRRRWEQLGSSDTYIWGHFSRPNHSPHLIAVRLADLTPVCPCTSLKHPCKFVLALMALYAKTPDLFNHSSTPEWVLKQQGTAEDQPPLLDPADALQETRTGFDEFGRWLRDQIRHGLSQFDAHSPTGLDAMANRLIDAHTPAIAEQLRTLAQTIAPRKGNPPENWPEILVKEFGRFYLLTQAWHKFDDLSPAEQNDLIQACVNPGVRERWAQHTAQEQVVDNWLILGRRFEPFGRTWIRRTWAIGEQTGRFALTETLISNRKRPASNLVTGTTISGSFAFDPSSLGAVGRFDLPNSTLKHAPSMSVPTEPCSLADKENDYLTVLSRNPWLPHCPVMLNQVSLQYDDQHGSWLLIDHEKRAIPLVDARDNYWTLLAHSKGEPLTLFAEWSADGVNLLSVCTDEGWRDLIVWGDRA